MELEKLDAWRPLLAEELKKPYFAALAERVDAAYETQTVFPPREELFTAFELTPPEAVRVVILGQDPYHEPGQAHGLAFSVRRGVKLPPSLRNIYQELESDLGISPAKDGDLSAWARQGVLLLNTVLTVESGKANSHKSFGWQRFTDAGARCVRRTPAARGFRPLGRTGAEKGPAAGGERRTAPDFAERAPESAQQLSRLFRQPTVFSDQRLPPRKRRSGDRLANRLKALRKTHVNFVP